MNNCSYLKVLFPAFLLCVAVFATACREAESDRSDAASTEAVAATESQVVTIRTKDFEFVEVPASIPAGLTSFQVLNEGSYPHNLGLVRLADGHTHEGLVEYMRSHEGAYPSWATLVGGPSAPLSGEDSEATFRLEPGQYALVCGVPVPGGMPHYMMGMTSPLTVTESEGPEGATPEADVRMVMDDYSFEITPAIEAGTRTIAVENAADQPHEFLLVRLEPGKTAGDVLEWLGGAINAEQEPLPSAPGAFLNGVSPMDKGEVNYITEEFTPGEYALICPYPDESDHNPHFVHGMVEQFSVEAAVAEGP